MSQHDFNIANQGGAAFRADLNNALAALVSQSSGNAEPTTTFAYMMWADTQNGLLKLRNAANNGWITVGSLNLANLGLAPLASLGALALLNAVGADQITDGAVGFAELASEVKNSMTDTNRIINGDMRIDQRNAGAAVTSTGDIYCVDRWGIGHGAPVNAFTAQRSTDAPAGFTHSLLITAGTGAGASSAGYAVLRQAIEGNNVADLGFGTANAQAVTISFRVKSSRTGTFGVVVRNNAGTRAYGATYAISAANTWETKTITIPGDTSGTWLTDNSIGLHLFFDLGAGSNYNITAGAWTTGTNMFGVTGTTKLTDATGATMRVTGVKLEKGSVATPFEVRQYGTELALCQRYYFQFNSSGLSDNAYAYSPYSPASYASLPNSSAAVPMYFPVTMRAAPTVSGTPNTGSLNRSTSTTGMAVFQWASPTTANSVYYVSAYTATAEL